MAVVERCTVQQVCVCVTLRQTASTATGRRGVLRTVSLHHAVLHQISASNAAPRVISSYREESKRSRPPPNQRRTPTVRTETRPATVPRSRLKTATTRRKPAAFPVPSIRHTLPVCDVEMCKPTSFNSSTRRYPKLLLFLLSNYTQKFKKKYLFIYLLAYSRTD